MFGNTWKKRFVVLTALLLSVLLFIPSLRHDVMHDADNKLTSDDKEAFAWLEEEVQRSETHPVPLSNFAEMGHRLRLLGSWLDSVKQLEKSNAPAVQTETIWRYSERLASGLLPFIVRSEYPRPLHRAIYDHNSGTRGIVITVGKRDFRFACHLIANIREILQSKLPIQIAYAGSEDLPHDYQQLIKKSFSNVELLDVLSKVNDSTLLLNTGKYAIKPFAVLASQFEQVILLDADTAFVQDPATMFSNPGYETTGAYLFHDRSIWAGHDRFHEDWWQEQFREIGHLSANIVKSRAMVERFSEHGESGVVVFDKRQLHVMMSLFHICWQNTFNVRANHTYEHAFGDKESWWFGFEALGAPYVMEKTYAVALGHACPQYTDQRRVCTNIIAHVDHRDQLLWWNGGLLKNKHVDQRMFDVPTKWMVEGKWFPADGSNNCSMTDAEYHDIQRHESDIVGKSIERARKLDALIEATLPSSVEFWSID